MAEKKTHHFWSKAWGDWRAPYNPAVRGNVDFQGGATVRSTPVKLPPGYCEYGKDKDEIQPTMRAA
jgi:hypothetical protein